MVRLESLLNTIERTPVSVKFLKSIVPKNVAVMHYQELRNHNRTSLFKTRVAVIVLIPHKTLKKGHYVCLVPHRKSIEYFSSLGMGPDQELVKLQHEENFMSSILGKNYTYNRSKLQNQSNYSVNTCGAFVFARARFFKYKLRDFLDLFRSISMQSPDDIVSCLVLLNFMDS